MHCTSYIRRTLPNLKFGNTTTPHRLLTHFWVPCISTHTTSDARLQEGDASRFGRLLRSVLQ